MFPQYYQTRENCFKIAVLYSFLTTSLQPINVNYFITKLSCHHADCSTGHRIKCGQNVPSMGNFCPLCIRVHKHGPLGVKISKVFSKIICG